MKFLQFLFIFLLSVTFFSSCKKRGCADPDALNFDINASKDDHSCYYYWIGQHYGGGDVFYIDQTKKHGLIAAPADLPSAHWGCNNTLIPYASETAVGKGLQNTTEIVKGCSAITAASLCYNLDTMGFNDWYLPSIEELHGLATSLGKLGQAKLGSGYYWSSTQIDASQAALVLFGNNAKTQNGKTGSNNVRAIRAF